MKAHPVKISEKDRMAIANLEKRVSHIEKTIKMLIDFNISKLKEDYEYMTSGNALRGR